MRGDDDENDGALFQAEMRNVVRLKPINRHDFAGDKSAARDEILREKSHEILPEKSVSLSLDADCSAAIQPVSIDQTNQGEQVLFARGGLQKKVIRSLKRGEIAVQSECDLHGLRGHEVTQTLENFIDHASRCGHRCVTIIHGKGNRSESRDGVLKPLTIKWLKECARVQGFCSAQQKDGGTGAVYVLLRGSG